MAANPSEIRSQLCDITVCGISGASNVPSGGGVSSVDLVLDHNVRVAGVEGVGSFSKSTGLIFGKVDRRSKFRTTKQAARVAVNGYKTVDEKLKIIDGPLIIGCVIFGIVFMLVR